MCILNTAKALLLGRQEKQNIYQGKLPSIKLIVQDIILLVQAHLKVKIERSLCINNVIAKTFKSTLW